MYHYYKIFGNLIDCERNEKLINLNSYENDTAFCDNITLASESNTDIINIYKKFIIFFKLLNNNYPNDGDAGSRPKHI
ncbi:PIR Superfamily Protein [Plasmodium ovale wallikeri]|uniref:PIR Superfamily Protein n=1 Tax=Plasmodium ovale wallikeri TaxID=864142 RepID=A0A1A9ALU0_PLAOA|nr:PIR Superfamily Protein [Plasmodium ovale wallikeri]SBT57045.1 PIR Superfamily Protein [Plasmodium ovale wallikeri]